MAVNEKCVVEFNGKDIDPSKIDNPRLRTIFQKRVHDGEKFLFRYGDHTDHGIGPSYSDYSDARRNHYDHKDRHSDSTIGAPLHTGYSQHSDKHR